MRTLLLYPRFLAYGYLGLASSLPEYHEPIPRLKVLRTAEVFGYRYKDDRGPKDFDLSFKITTLFGNSY